MSPVDRFLAKFTPYNLPVFKNGVRLPEVRLTETDKTVLGLAPQASNKAYFFALANKLLNEKIALGKILQPKDECVKRLEMEFEVFEKTGTIDYLIILMDVFVGCDRDKVPRGVGRGSAAGSFTLYVVGLTNVNPLNHDLNFTRFLNEARAKTHLVDGVMHVDGKSFADFDGDISFKRRPEVLRRIEKDYPGKTCKILTLNYLTGRTALKDTLKSVLEYSETEASEVTEHIEDVFGKCDSLLKTVSKSKDFEKWSKDNPATFKLAQKIEGLLRGSGQHASGILICYYELKDIMPMELAPSGELICGYDMDVALTMSLKIDLLGLRTLDVLQTCADITGIPYMDINVNDPKTYGYYKTNKRFYGLFQIKDGLTKDVVVQVQPKDIDQLASCISISRPGALIYIPNYVKFVRDGTKTAIYTPLDNLLAPTGGLILYQEQINDICQKLYEMSAVDADDVRRAIGKKLRADMAKWEPVLYANGKRLNIPETVTKWFWDTCNASADYLFNKNHCYSYSYLTNYTTFYKENFSQIFYLACFQMARHEQEPIECITKLQGELQEISMPLFAPDIVKSEDDYTMEKSGIRMGLSGIKGVNDKGLLKLHNLNKETANKFAIMEAFFGAGISISTIAPLILAGCIETSGQSRSKLLLEFELYKLLTAKEIPLVHSLGEKYNYDLHTIIKEMVEVLKNEKGKPLIKDTRFATIKKNIEPYTEKYRRNVKHEELSSWVFENEYLGFSHSTTLFKIYSKTVKSLKQAKDVLTLPTESRCVFVARISEIDKRISKKKQDDYLYMKLQDETGLIKGFLWTRQKIEVTNEENGRPLAAGDIVICHGKRNDRDGVWVDHCILQSNEVILKKSELKLSVVNNT